METTGCRGFSWRIASKTLCRVYVQVISIWLMSVRLSPQSTVHVIVSLHDKMSEPFHVCTWVSLFLDVWVFWIRRSQGQVTVRLTRQWNVEMWRSWMIVEVLCVCVWTAKQFKYPDIEQRKPPVPRPSERPVMGLRTTKNYVTENAVENIKSVPPRPAKVYCDTRHGDKHSLIPSGLEPVYLHKKVRQHLLLFLRC